MKYSEYAIDRILKMGDIKEEKYYSYAIIHAADDKVTKHFVSAPYDAIVLFAICAYVQFELHELDDTYGLCQDEMVDILVKLYDCQASPKRLVKAEKIDLYYAWEAFCGQCDVLQNIESLKRDGLRALLQTYIDLYRAGKNDSK
jgi:hypothetical protein